MEEQAGALIAIVDDDESVRQATASLLRSNRLKPETFSSAEEFLTSTLLAKTRCLLLDIGLPGMDGLELQRRLDQMGWRIPIIFITARDEPILRRAAMRAGRIDFLGKPFSGTALLSAICSALETPTNENYEYHD